VLPEKKRLVNLIKKNGGFTAKTMGVSPDTNPTRGI
jgi:hypothetical protein